ncbi:5'-nucleotidase C-terminal domain-containing protein [Clostridium sp. Cult1]|uniref:5'-nucleotidase C-terminal domain-containing protein n=1 Tax=Clostridium sp. Cult1 TaxID=2079002 RepID=UPI001F010A29|nr:multifunctional 2',3'-cyclic-nucleotide 2'-phosphodiesterase/5'-nucleotidase/3'-nucleotidase [Clostridium sp. Cult1]
MSYKGKKLFSLVLSFLLIIGVFTLPAQAEEGTVQLTILGTTDLHANIYNWSYEDGKEVEDLGIAKVYSVIKEIREENPNTLLLDNGDTIQGTILSDDLYNTKLDLPHPVIDVMNFMEYDAMTLGNHEFNFGLELIDKIVEEAEFPILGANIYWKDGTNFAKPYIIKEVAGIKIGILGLGNPNIPRWDGPKVTELEFEAIDKAADKYVKELKDQVDIIIATAHAGLEEEYSEADSVRLAIEKNPEIQAMLVGHSHASVAETVGTTLVGGARDAGRQVVRFDLTLKKDGETWNVIDRKVELIEVTDYEASEELKEYAKEYHEATLEFLEDVIGQATEDFHPASEVKGIPEGQIRDTAVMDLINDVQLKYSGADISSAALFQPSSNIRKGDITYSSIFDIYKYPNTLVGVEVTGKELKDYMEWSASYYNTYKPGDITISFNPDIRAYNYDMFQGVDYKIDISKPAGERIVDLKFKGEPVKDEDTFKLTINNYRLSGLQSMGIISGEPYFNSDPISLRSYIAQYIRESGTIEPKVDNNWEIIGADLDHPLRDYIIEQVNEGKIEIPTSEDGRSINSRALNVYELIKEGLIPEEVLREHASSSIEVEESVVVEEVKVDEYVVKSGDVLWKIAEKFNTTWEKLAEYNKMKNPHLIFPGQKILIPAN